MHKIFLLMILSGFLFGGWPPVAGLSRMNGWTQTLVFEIFACLVVIPICLFQGVTIRGTSWPFGALAGIMGGVGVLLFVGILARSKPEDLARLFIINLLAQIAVPAVYNCFVGGLTAKTIMGFILAVAAVFCLV